MLNLDLIAHAAPEMLTPELRAAVGRLDPADVAEAEYRPANRDAARRAAALARISEILLETLNAPNDR